VLIPVEWDLLMAAKEQKEKNTDPAGSRPTRIVITRES